MSTFVLTDLVNTNTPYVSLAKVLYEFAKKDYSWISPLDKTCQGNLPDLVKKYSDVDQFVQACNKNVNCLIDLIIEICQRLPQTLTIGMFFPDTLEVDDCIVSFLREIVQKKSDSRLCIAGNCKEIDLSD